MYAEERQQAIAGLVASEGRLSVLQLAERYGVTTETIRRDLSVLERAGLVRREADPSDGHPGCVVWEYHRKFNPAEAEDIARRCRSGELACVPDKKHLAQVLTDALAPVRERRAKYEAAPDRVREIIADGNARARAVAEDTMARVRDAMGLSPRALERAR